MRKIWKRVCTGILALATVITALPITSVHAAQIEDVALSLEYVKQYTGSHTNLNANQRYLLEQCVVWQRLSEHLGWQCDNVRAAYSEISQNIQSEVYAISGATFGVFSDQNCNNQIGTLTTDTTDENGDTNEVEVTGWDHRIGIYNLSMKL